MGTYLVTGCAGFIGWKVTELLLAGNHIVIGIDNINEAYDVRLKQWRLAQLGATSGFEFYQIDICDRNALNDLVDSVTAQGISIEAVINLAARAGVRASVEDPHMYFETNVIGTLNLLELSRYYKIPKFVQASTSSLYGKDNNVPYNEDQNTDKPLSPYAASKKAAEAFCHVYHYLHGLNITVLRYFTVYGPAGRPDMAPFRFVKWILEGEPLILYGDGTQSRDFTYVDDIARGTVRSLDLQGFQIINLGSDHPIVLTEFIKIVEAACQKEAQIIHQQRHAADALVTWANIERAKSLMNWQPQVGIEHGVRNMVKWYQENRDWARTISD